MTGVCLKDPRGDRQETGWFVEGTQPKDFCQCHVPALYDAEGEGIAFAECAESHKLSVVGLISAERDFPCEVYVIDAQYVMKSIPDDVFPDSRDGNPFFFAMLEDSHYCGISDEKRQYNSACRKHYEYSPWE